MSATIQHVLPVEVIAQILFATAAVIWIVGATILIGLFILNLLVVGCGRTRLFASM
jgi:hypothetical protein